MTIKDYISGSRKNIYNTGSTPTDALVEYTLKSRYYGIFELLKLGIKADLSHVSLEVAYSTNKTAETVFDLEGKAYLIVDRYLGQCFSMFTRIFFNSSNTSEAESYSYKLLAEELQIAGYLQEARLCAGVYVLEIDKSSTYKQEADGSLRNKYVLIQEAFIIAHELAHFVLYNEKDKGILDNIKESVLLLLDDSPSASPITDEDVDTYLQDIHVLYYPKDTSYKDYLSKEKIEATKADLQNTRDNQSKVLIDFIQKDNKLIEEMYCDDLAFQVLINVLANNNSISKSIIIDSVYIALMNLRTLGIINSIVFDLMQEKRESEQFIRASMLRLMRYRDKATIFYGELYSAGTSKEIHQMLTKTNIRYNQIIGDSINFLTYDNLLRVKELGKKLPEITYKYFNDINKQIDTVLNH